MNKTANITIAKTIAAAALFAGSGTALGTITFSALPGETSDAPGAEQAASIQMAEIQGAEKTIGLSVDGKGHVEAAGNCSVEDGEIRFTDVSRNAEIRLVADGGGEAEARDGGRVLPVRDGIVKLLAFADYGKLEVAFPEPVAEGAFADADEEAIQGEPATEPETEPEPAEKTEPAIDEARQEPVAEETAPEPATMEPAAPEEAAPVYEEPVCEQPVAEAPVVNIPAHEMDAYELADAHAVFDAYNAWRAAKGLPTFEWDEACANMGYWSARGCAERGDLIHKLGIPEELHHQYSDILQCCSWHSPAGEVIANWEQSTGHRRMMQCETATCAGVGVYGDGGTNVYAIVYGFTMCNQSGE